jgi:hypothetical protein
MLILQLWGGNVHWSQLPVYLRAELLAGAARRLLYVALSATPPTHRHPYVVALTPPQESRLKKLINDPPTSSARRCRVDGAPSRTAGRPPEQDHLSGGRAGPGKVG